MDINQVITGELGVKRWQVDAAVKLIDEGNTIPFIARYRKEVTGTLDDAQLRTLHERLMYLRNLEEKKEQVLASIEEQGKLTEELKKQILAAETMVVVEDLYRPYRPKRRTRAMIAKEKGLEPLAALITLQKAEKPIEVYAEEYVNPEKEVKSVKEAIDGAKDIIAESVSDEADYRSWIRKATVQHGKVISQAKDEKAESVYEMYYDFEEPVTKLAGHRVLALNRGEKEKFLTVKIEAPQDDILRYLEKKMIHSDNPHTIPILKEVAEDSYKRLIAPAIEREIRSDLTEKAEDGAISVFKKNLHQLLMQPPIVGQTVLGWDPAFRTGCKLAVVDPTGKVIGTTVIYPTAPTTPKKIQASKDLLKKIIAKYNITLISVGNGTASRESEQFIVELLKEIPQKVQYVIVNEAGASVYSASKLASEEFPKFDVGQRSATSIARRLQDPLADLSLVRGVSGLEIFFGKHALDHCWNVMVVRAGATEDVWEDLILFRDRCDDAAGFELTLAFWQVERCFQLHIFRDDAEHVVKRIVAAGFEHLLTFFVGIRHIAAHRVSPSFSFYEERFRLLIIRGLRGRFCIRLRSSDRRLLQNR